MRAGGIRRLRTRQHRSARAAPGPQSSRRRRRLDNTGKLPRRQSSRWRQARACALHRVAGELAGRLLVEAPRTPPRRSRAAPRCRHGRLCPLGSITASSCGRWCRGCPLRLARSFLALSLALQRGISLLDLRLGARQAPVPSASDASAKLVVVDALGGAGQNIGATHLGDDVLELGPCGRRAGGPRWQWPQRSASRAAWASRAEKEQRMQSVDGVGQR